MKKMVYGLAFISFAALYSPVLGQLQNNTNEGGACKVGGSTGTYDEDGWCCVTRYDVTKCTECTDATGKSTGKCSDAITKVIQLMYPINGHWIVLNDKSGKTMGITITKNLIKVDLTTFRRPAAKGFLIDNKTIRVLFADKNLTITGKLTSAGRIEWSNGTIWIRKPTVQVTRNQ